MRPAHPPDRRAELVVVAVLDFGDSGLIDISVDGNACQGSQKVGVHVGVRDEKLPAREKRRSTLASCAEGAKRSA